MKETLEARVLRLASRANGVRPGYVDHKTVCRLLDEGMLTQMGHSVYTTALGLKLNEVNEYKRASRDPRLYRVKLSKAFDCVTAEEFELLKTIEGKTRPEIKDDWLPEARKLLARGLVHVNEKFDKRDGKLNFIIQINGRGRRALAWRRKREG